MPDFDRTQREVRAFPFEIRAEGGEGEERTVTGRAVVYGSRTDLGYFDEIIAPGALDDADLRDVPLLVNHNAGALPLARSRRNNENSSMQLIPVEGEGLDIRARLDIENNADARAVYSAIERGDVAGMSFAFNVDSARWEDLESEHPTRIIEKVSRVFEVSIVTWPAYAETSIHARGMRTAPEGAAAALESAKAEKRRVETRRQKIKILTEV